jgi:hypothetical protein
MLSHLSLPTFFLQSCTSNLNSRLIGVADFARILPAGHQRLRERLPTPACPLAECKPQSENSQTVTKQVGDRQRPGDVPMSGRSKDVDALVLPGGKWPPHDLRRTAATTMAELGALPDVVEKCLNHTEVGKVKRIYQRAQYDGPMRDAWRLLGTRFDLLQGMADGSVTNVVPMQRSR